jgi:hypothetical protein
MAGPSSASVGAYYIPPVSAKEQALLALEEELFELWGHITAATYRFLELVAEYDRREGWARHGVASCAQWLSWQCGIGRVAAREKVRVARALENLPKIGEAFRRGVVSYSKVRAMTRIATPDNEATLLNVAEHGTAAHVEKLVRKYCYVERLEEAQRANAQHYDRHLTFSYDEHGSVVMHARLPAEVGAVVRKAIEVAVALRAERKTNASASAEADESDWFHVNNLHGAKRADALRALAESFLSQQADYAGTAADRCQMVVHIDQRLLASSDRALDESGLPPPHRCELEDEHTLAVETARRLGCDCAIVGIVEDEDGEPLDVGRKTRSISPALQRALKSRDGGCRFPGCNRTRFTEGHHVAHWANGGETKLSNLITLCWFHHRLVHEGGFGLRATDDSVFVFTRPDGSRVEANGALKVRFRGSAATAFELDRLFEQNLSRGVRIDEETSRCRWIGDRMDYGLAVGDLIWLRDRARQAEGSQVTQAARA